MSRLLANSHLPEGAAGHKDELREMQDTAANDRLKSAHVSLDLFQVKSLFRHY